MTSRDDESNALAGGSSLRRSVAVCKGESRGRMLARVANFIKNAPRRGAFLFGVKCRNYGTGECCQEGQKENNRFAFL